MSAVYDYLEILAWLLTFLVAPFALGLGICRMLRVKEYGVRLACILFTVFLAFLPFARAIVQTERFTYRTASNEYVSADKVTEAVDPETKEPTRVVADTKQPVRIELLPRKDVDYVDGHWVLAKDHAITIVNRTTVDFSRWQNAMSFGIDLAGGTNLIYEVDEEQARADNITIDNDLMERLVSAVQKRVNPAGTKEIVVRQTGRTRIEIILPGADPAVVEDTKAQITKLGSLEFSIVANRLDHPDLIRRALASPSKEVRDKEGNQGRWRPIAPNPGPGGTEVPNLEFDDNPDIAVRQIPERPAGFKEVLILYEPDPEKQISGKLLKRANPTNDNKGQPAVGFHFNTKGGYLFMDLTTRFKPRKDGSRRQLAVMLNGQVFTAPSINQPIGADGIIESSRFTLKEVQQLVGVLNAGALPVPIKTAPISEFSISPTLGFDVQSKGKLALWLSSIAVIVFMAVYYFVAGLVADLALLLNLLFIVSIMAFIKAAFTLPGLAGLVLSAGMAVDSNVLIYERMREELHRGASLRMAIHNGFDKAFAAIFDSHITSLITAVILYMIGTETVKGFAVSLFIGLVMNLFTAVYVSRVIVNILERSRLVRNFKMLSLIGVTNFDFVGKQKIASAISAALILAGLVAFIARGDSNYDIDFTGGTSVTMQFNEPQSADDVRNKLEETFNKNITVEELTSSAQTKGTYYRLRVANEGQQDVDPKEIEQKVNETFPGKLVRKNVSVGELRTLPAEKPATKDQAPAAEFDERFAGGSEVALAFTDDKGRPAEIAPATFNRYLHDRLITFMAGGKPKYPDPDALLELAGVSGSGMQAMEGRVKTYSSLKLLTTKAIAQDDLKSTLAEIQQTMQNTPLFDEVTTFDKAVAGETKTSAVIAIIASLIAIVIYLWFRFENLIFGLACVIALAHDVLVALSCVALASYVAHTPIGSLLMLTDFKINMPMIAAFLTIAGYSTNDTIVIFDRLREVRGKNPVITREMINDTVNQTLGRTLLTAFTVLLSVLILYVVGGEGIHGFAFCMLIGAIAGTYSTVYIASPLVLVFMQRMTGQPRSRREGLGPQGVAAM